MSLPPDILLGLALLAVIVMLAVVLQVLGLLFIARHIVRTSEDSQHEYLGHVPPYPMPAPAAPVPAGLQRAWKDTESHL